MFAASFCFNFIQGAEVTGRVKRIRIRRRRSGDLGFRGDNDCGDSITVSDNLDHQVVIAANKNDPDGLQTVNLVYILSASMGTDSPLFPDCQLMGPDALDKCPAETVDGSYVMMI